MDPRNWSPRNPWLNSCVLSVALSYISHAESINKSLRNRPVIRRGPSASLVWFDRCYIHSCSTSHRVCTQFRCVLFFCGCGCSDITIYMYCDSYKFDHHCVFVWLIFFRKAACFSWKPILNQYIDLVKHAPITGDPLNNIAELHTS